MGFHLGRVGAKRGGLFKKTMTFDVFGQEYFVMNYYNVADVLADRLPRPRALAPGLTIQMSALSADY
jgi:hypothetical protein